MGTKSFTGSMWAPLGEVVRGQVQRNSVPVPPVHLGFVFASFPAEGWEVEEGLYKRQLNVGDPHSQIHALWMYLQTLRWTYGKEQCVLVVIVLTFHSINVGTSHSHLFLWGIEVKGIFILWKGSVYGKVLLQPALSLLFYLSCNYTIIHAALFLFFHHHNYFFKKKTFRDVWEGKVETTEKFPL